MKSWYAVQTKSNLENFVIRNLEKNNYNTYMPCYETNISHARKSKNVIKPLFPNYFFVELSIDSKGFREINYTRGVVSILNAGYEPIVVPNNIIENFKKLEDENGFINFSQFLKFTIGQDVKISSGLFRGKIGSFLGLSGKDRFLVLLNILGKSIRVPAKEICSTV